VVMINGEKNYVDGKNLLEYMISFGYDTKRVAVEFNGNILPKSDYDKIVLSDGDRIEIVSFVGGG